MKITKEFGFDNTLHFIELESVPNYIMIVVSKCVPSNKDQDSKLIIQIS